MYKATILPLAKQDIREAATWYNQQQDGLGKRFLQFVRQKVNKILLQPQLYAVRYANVHTAILDVFPFMIHFILNEDTKTIVIIAVLHTSQNPDIWQEREQ